MSDYIVAHIFVAANLKSFRFSHQIPPRLLHRGAKVGEGAKISVFNLHDPDLLDVGAHATIGHTAQKFVEMIPEKKTWELRLVLRGLRSSNTFFGVGVAIELRSFDCRGLLDCYFDIRMYPP